MAAIFGKYPRLLALLAGGVSATGFEPLGLWPLTLLCLGVLMQCVAQADSGKRALLIGWLFGLGHFTLGNNWIATAFTYQANMPVWLGWCAVPLLALYLAVYPGLAAWGTWRIARFVVPAKDKATVTLPFILSFAGCWIITEWLRSWVFSGFAWNPLAIVTINFGWLTKPAAYLGTYGQSGLVILAVGLTMICVRHVLHELRKKPLTPGRIAFVIAFFVLPEAVVLLALPFFLGPNTATDSDQKITIVQPGITQDERNDPLLANRNDRKLVKLSQLDNDSKAGLLFWPESGLQWRLESGYPYRYYQDQPGEDAAVTRSVVATLLGPNDILLTGNDRLVMDKAGQLIGAHNSVAAMNAKGKLLGWYDKAHLVPYGEYLALRWLLEPLGVERLVPGTIDFWPGPGPRTMSLGETKPKVGIQICYEIIFSGQVVDRNNRPDFIFNPSNDAWFGSGGPPQHLAQARLRAIEEGLPVIRSTPTGISAIINADGRIVKSLPLGKTGRIDGFLPKAKAPTLFARYGNILPLGFSALLLTLSFLALAQRRTLR